MAVRRSVSSVVRQALPAAEAGHVLGAGYEAENTLVVTIDRAEVTEKIYRHSARVVVALEGAGYRVPDAFQVRVQPGGIAEAA